jgi:hypothetical protein
MRKGPFAITIAVAIVAACTDSRQAPDTTPGKNGTGGGPVAFDVNPVAQAASEASSGSGFPTSSSNSSSSGFTSSSGGGFGGGFTITPTTNGVATSTTATGIGGGFK